MILANYRKRRTLNRIRKELAYFGVCTDDMTDEEVEKTIQTIAKTISMADSAKDFFQAMDAAYTWQGELRLR